MSYTCPLCGNEKLPHAILCDSCTHKFKDEYEVKFPEEHDASKGKDNIENSTDNHIETVTPIVMTESEMDARTRAVVDEENTSEPAKSESKEPVSSAQKSSIPENAETLRIKKKTPKWIKVLLWLCLLGFIAAVGVYIYKTQIRHHNLELAAWETASRENSVDAYRVYIETYPEGEHVADAQQKMRLLKDKQAEAWQNLRQSDNTSEFHDFLNNYPDSPYEKLVRNKLDSLMWQAALKVNVAESYADYITMADSRDIPGEYIAEAESRFKMLNQKLIPDAQEIDSIRTTVSGFYVGLSNVSFEQLSNYLAPKLYRFFQSGHIESSKVMGELMMMAAKSEVKTINFIPNTDALAYEKTAANIFKINVPLKKTYVDKQGTKHEVPGYIAHIEVTPDFKIQSVYETKPFTASF